MLWYKMATQCLSLNFKLVHKLDLRSRIQIRACKIPDSITKSFHSLSNFITWESSICRKEQIMIWYKSIFESLTSQIINWIERFHEIAVPSSEWDGQMLLPATFPLPLHWFCGSALFGPAKVKLQMHLAKTNKEGKRDLEGRLRRGDQEGVRTPFEWGGQINSEIPLPSKFHSLPQH